jgi:hypothetical protein
MLMGFLTAVVAIISQFTIFFMGVEAGWFCSCGVPSSRGMVATFGKRKLHGKAERPGCA